MVAVAQGSTRGLLSISSVRATVNPDRSGDFFFSRLRGRPGPHFAREGAPDPTGRPTEGVAREDRCDCEIEKMREGKKKKRL